MRKLSAAAPQYSFSHAILASKPPAAATKRAAADRRGAAFVFHHRGDEKAVDDIERGHRRVVNAGHAQRLGAPIERVERAASAAEEERIGLAQAQRTAERRLEAHALFVHPAEQFGRARHRQLGECRVGLAAGDPIEIAEEFGFGVRPGHGRCAAVVGEAQVAGVAGVAAAIKGRRAFDHDHAGAGARRGDRRAQRRIAAAGHHHIVGVVEIHRGAINASLRQRWQCEFAGASCPIIGSRFSGSCA